MMPANPPDAKPRPTLKSGVVVPHQAKWHQRIVAALIVALIRSIAVTVRFRLVDKSGLFGNGVPPEQVIFAIWHNRLALAAIIHERYVRRFARERRMAGLVSASRDGGLLARILEIFQIEPVRGSSSRRGSQALRELISCAERGRDLAITPDGPRGPCYAVQEGVVSAAQLTGLVIVPVAYRLAWKIRAKSWDRFQIPLPFTKCDVTTGRLFRIPRAATDTERETYRQELEAELRSITFD
jgi:lysophospholipid acyltransferase (LPLAT)-like uncharacterized protein